MARGRRDRQHHHLALRRMGELLAERLQDVDQHLTGWTGRSPCSRPPTAGAGWSTCWRSWSWSRTWSIPAAVRRSPRLGSRTTRSMRPPWPSCCGRICCPRPGSPPRPHGICGRCCVTGPPWSGCRPRSRTGCMRCWPTVASPKTGACGLVLGGLGRQAWCCRRPRGDHPGRRWAAGRPGHPIARREREIATLAKPDPRVQALLALPV
jgi:hypothetical protein